jgi:hypothetical protein
MKQNKKDILDKLNNRNPGFSVPENYFDEFEENLNEFRKKQNSGFLAPEKYFAAFDEKILFRIKENPKITTGFKTPDNYLKNIDQKILGNIRKEKRGEIIKLNTNKALKILSFAIAASLMLFFSLKNLNSSNKGFDMETIEIAEIESWMEEDLITFSSYDISETFNDVYLTGNIVYTEEEIEDYLDGVNIENLIFEN